MAISLNLAVTRVGDLLLQNTITQDKDGEPINDVDLIIPNYQRPYKWTSKNVIQLLDDILNAKNTNKEKYRIGTLILCTGEKEGKFVYEIVDGQQRLITFSLLLKALGCENIKLIEQPLSNNPYNRQNIPNNFQILEREINRIKDIEKKEILNYIKNNCELIIIITNDISEAFQFFDSQNARGKKLYPHDLLKAYHLREMSGCDAAETEKAVKCWEDLDQKELASLFSDYLYRVKEWIRGNKAWELNEHNIQKFKGVTRQDVFPYAQFHKGAFAYADSVNNSAFPFVSGMHKLRPFQLDAPVIAGKPFFDYAKYYFETLKNIQKNDKYDGFVNDNKIIKTLNLRKYKNGVGNRITRLLFDTALLLYVDRFYQERPTNNDNVILEQFIIFDFIWAYSLRAQYLKVGWAAAQKFILGDAENDKKNAFNIYKIITESDSPMSLLGTLSDKIKSLSNIVASKENIEQSDEDDVRQNYLYYFKEYKYLEI